MRACGWNVLEVADGCYDVEGIVKALLKAEESHDRPTFINIRTVIGIGSKVAADAKAHGAAYGSEDVRGIEQAFGMNQDEHFVVHDEVYSYFADTRFRGDALVEAWTCLLEAYRHQHPQLYAELRLRMDGKFPDDWEIMIPDREAFSSDPTAPRQSAGLICNPLAANLKNFMVGTADLSPSVAMIWKDKVNFQHVSVDFP